MIAHQPRPAHRRYPDPAPSPERAGMRAEEAPKMFMNTLEVLASSPVQEHLNRNPRVVRFFDHPQGDGEVWIVEFDRTIPVSPAVAAEASGLELWSLGCRPHAEGGAA